MHILHTLYFTNCVVRGVGPKFRLVVGTLTDYMNLGTNIVIMVISSFKPASLNPKTASCKKL